MQDEGPTLQVLTHRLAECPAEFLAEPRIGKTGVVHVDAVVADLLRDLGMASIARDRLEMFKTDQRNWLQVVLVASWLFHDEWFAQDKQYADLVYTCLVDGLKDIAGVVQAPHFVADPDRREELVRTCLSGLGLRPAGESVAQAEDRLETLSSIDRQRVINAARVAEQRAQAIREAMTRQAAEEAAAKYTRE